MSNLELKRPALLLDREKCLNNIAFMAEKAKRHNLTLRPHFKTHQSAAISRWFREHGTRKITVSSVIMAEYFAEEGWDDICVAFPFNIHEINDARRLAEKIRLHLTVCSAEITQFISKAAMPETGIYIKTDTGYRRTGIEHENTPEIDRILEIIKKSKNLTFSGFLVHNGHTYQSPTPFDVKKIHSESNARLLELKRRYIREFAGLVLSTGDTPSCSISDDFTGIDEIRPGNYVFYDLSQCHTGSCIPSQVAVALAAPVVAKHPGRNELIIYGGAVHLSKEHLVNDDGVKIWGQAARLLPNGRWTEPVPGAMVTKVSQEHGTITCDTGFFNQIAVGDFIVIFPVHSCLTADLMRGYITTSGERIDHISGNPPAVQEK